VLGADQFFSGISVAAATAAPSRRIIATDTGISRCRNSFMKLPFRKLGRPGPVAAEDKAGQVTGFFRIQKKAT
jgi:hypothetical protein